MHFPSLLLLTAGCIAYAHPTEHHHDREHDQGNSEAIQQRLDISLNAMGGRNALKSIDSVTYTANTIYRSNTLGQSYNLFTTDQSVASGGSQNMAFSFSANGLKSCLDRAYKYDYYWSWGRPQLEPSMGFSFVTQDGAEGFTCFNQGQNSFFVPDPTIPPGYSDPFLSDYLIHHAHQFAFLWLLNEFANNIDKLRLGYETDLVAGSRHVALFHSELELSILINSTTNLPSIIRSYENHAVFGRLTEAALEDSIIDSAIINPSLHSDFFDPHPPLPKPEQGQFQLQNTSRPARNSEYPRFEVHEFFESGLWAGPFGDIVNVSDVQTTFPIPCCPQIQTIFVEYPVYVQLLIEIEDGLLITDAPRPYSNGSHEHEREKGGVADYIAAGATLVIPDFAKAFYNLFPNSPDPKIITYSNPHPFHKDDEVVQFTSHLGVENPQAKDWTFAIAGTAQPSRDQDLALDNADVINPGTDAVQ
ncbi:Hypothetical protein R9X50_00715400 [Acrodontium crateriforme]|uniref:Uncharacterized protein n=1 Tax=Acrodontium crateriforme TaxID=150365 RepID=A0AAQ3MAX0_9PEZI|nr:Hypothetical protein R9X50_00715400 [Acrodontium crateriforme]